MGRVQSAVIVQGPLSDERFDAALAGLQPGIREVTVSGPLTEAQVTELVSKLQGLPRLPRVQIQETSLTRAQYATLLGQLRRLSAEAGVATVQAIVDSQPMTATILDGAVHPVTSSEIAAREREADAEAAEMQVLTSKPAGPGAAITLTLPAPPAQQ